MATYGTAQQIVSTLTTGTSPLSVSSTTVNTNFNADKLDGYDASNSTGQVPISNGTKNTNLNADMVDGKSMNATRTGTFTATNGTTVSGTLFTGGLSSDWIVASVDITDSAWTGLDMAVSVNLSGTTWQYYCWNNSGADRTNIRIMSVVLW